MKCKECGGKLDIGMKYCPYCGTSSSEESMFAEDNTVSFKQLICDECNATFEFDAEKNILCCPYCGSKKIIVESDNVRISKYNIDAEKEIKKFQEQYRHMEEVDNRRHVRLQYIIFGVIFVLFCLFATLDDYVTEKVHNFSPKIESSYSSSDYKGLDVESVTAELEAEGFTNIKLVIEKTNAFQKGKVGQVKEVRIKKSTLNKNVSYYANEQVEVVYYDDKLPSNN